MRGLAELCPDAVSFYLGAVEDSAFHDGGLLLPVSTQEARQEFRVPRAPYRAISAAVVYVHTAGGSIDAVAVNWTEGLRENQT